MKFFLKYSFLILLLLTCLIALPFGLYHTVGATETGAASSVPGPGAPVSAADGTAVPSAEPVIQVISAGGQDSPPSPEVPPKSADDPPAASAPPVSSAAPSAPVGSAAPEVPPPEPTPEPAENTGEAVAPGDGTGAYTSVSADYLDDALFIGDSRTVGISEYGGLGNADFFASTGMSVYNVFKNKVSVGDFGYTDLAGLLKAQTYGKIYVMLGINELGYDYAQTVGVYSDVITQIREYAPDALIFIEANLHVSASKSAADAIFNNVNIDRFNGDISKLADGDTVFYLDVNPIFDDGSGNLAAGYSGDEIHIYAKHYKAWSDWLLTKGIVKEK